MQGCVIILIMIIIIIIIIMIVASMIISGDGRLTATEGSPPLPLLSVSLFGRVYSEDADQPLDFCPGGN